MTAPPLERHLSRGGLADYLAHGPSTLAVPGSPACRILFDPRRSTIALRTPHSGGARPDLSRFENVDEAVIAEGGDAWSEVTIRYDEQEYEAYLLIGDIADMIQQDGLSFADAVPAALSTFGDLLARAGSLSAERQTGLYGEMLFLESCMAGLGPEPAVESWKGYAPNEHDFVFAAGCFEVKSTRTERRRHTISGLEQLDSTPGTPLWLISIQITTATSTTGRSLAQVVDDVREAAGPARPALDTALRQAGWRDRDRALYADPRTLRSVPAGYLVDSSFPVLNRRVIESGCPRPEMIVGATYAIDLSALPAGSPPSPAAAFVTGDHHVGR